MRVFACWTLFRHVCWLTKPPEGWCEEFGRCMNLGSSVLIKEECNSQNFSEIRLTARSNGVVGLNILAFPWSTATNAQFHGWVVLLAAWERIVFNFRARHNCKLMITIFPQCVIYEPTVKQTSFAICYGFVWSSLNSFVSSASTVIIGCRWELRWKVVPRHKRHFYLFLIYVVSGDCEAECCRLASFYSILKPTCSMK